MNTTFEWYEDFVFRGKTIDAGKYALFTILNPEEWEVMLYKDTDN